MIALVVDPALSLVAFGGEECGRIISGFKSDIGRLDMYGPGVMVTLAIRRDFAHWF